MRDEERTLHLLLDGPDNYRDATRLYYEGSNLRLVDGITSYLRCNRERIASVHAALYLYSTPALAGALGEASANGAHVVVTTIPLEGYDASAVEVTSLSAGTRFPASKLGIADRVYSWTVSTDGGGIELRLFPHVFVRSTKVRPFSRGRTMYSLHTKTLMIEFNDGSGAVALTSSNMSGRDAIKDELLLIVEDCPETLDSARAFFRALEASSVTGDDVYDSTHFQVAEVAPPYGESPTLFTGPFFRDSSRMAEDRLYTMLERATDRIIVCGQHVCAYDYEYEGLYLDPPCNEKVRRQGMLAPLLEGDCPETAILSQTFVDDLGNSRGCRKPANTSSFSRFFAELQSQGRASYFTSDDLHLKFVVADDHVALTTSNFTPTSFIYLPNVNITAFEHDPGLTYRGCHAEVGHYFFCESRRLARALVDYTESITARNATQKQL